jgi:DNA repair exonuclease SbcCD ATPase subunit
MSFSEGEKKRIDIAIMLSFIDTTKTISNWNCNLLMFDEILDTSIDSEGLDKIMGAIKQMTIDDSKLCSYIISHRDNDHENYSRKMIVKKVGGFSTIG